MVDENPIFKEKLERILKESKLLRHSSELEPAIQKSLDLFARMVVEAGELLEYLMSTSERHRKSNFLDRFIFRTIVATLFLKGIYFRKKEIGYGKRK